MGELQEDQKPISKSQLKRDAQQLLNLGKELTSWSEGELQALELPTQLFEALLGAKQITSNGARKRHLLYIGKLLRSIDATEIREAIEARRAESDGLTAHHHRLEQWRERLIEEGDGVLTELLSELPGANSQRLRQLIRQSRKERQEQSPPRAYRELFRELRELFNTN